jgi:hypothetical protein
MENKITFTKLTFFSLILFVVHLVLNLLVAEPISFFLVVILHFFYYITLVFSVSFMKTGDPKDSSRIWINFLVTVFVKFAVFLGFILGIKTYFEISKTQALLHVFIWFFIYFFIEMKMILETIKTVNKQ